MLGGGQTESMDALKREISPKEFYARASGPVMTISGTSSGNSASGTLSLAVGPSGCPDPMGVAAMDAAPPVEQSMRKRLPRELAWQEKESVTQRITDKDTVDEGVSTGTETQDSFGCRWGTCSSRFQSHRDMILHVNHHISTNIDWVSLASGTPPKPDSVSPVCQWQGCWNPHPFTSQQRMIGMPSLT
jgi:hypothetical protein